jgi:hypothetical protein
MPAAFLFAATIELQPLVLRYVSKVSLGKQGRGL